MPTEDQKIWTVPIVPASRLEEVEKERDDWRLQRQQERSAQLLRLRRMHRD